MGVQWTLVDSGGLHLEMSPPLSEKVSPVGVQWTQVNWNPVEFTGLHLKMSPPLSEKVSPLESKGVQLDSVGEGKVLIDHTKNDEVIKNLFQV